MQFYERSHKSILQQLEFSVWHISFISMEYPQTIQWHKGYDVIGLWGRHIQELFYKKFSRAMLLAKKKKKIHFVIKTKYEKHDASKKLIIHNEKSGIDA